MGALAAALAFGNGYVRGNELQSFTGACCEKVGLRARRRCLLLTHPQQFAGIGGDDDVEIRFWHCGRRFASNVREHI